MNRIQKLCILICVFSPFLIFGAYIRGADIDELILRCATSLPRNPRRL